LPSLTRHFGQPGLEPGAGAGLFGVIDHLVDAFLRAPTTSDAASFRKPVSSTNVTDRGQIGGVGDE